jgi:hypothetical protein
MTIEKTRIELMGEFLEAKMCQPSFPYINKDARGNSKEAVLLKMEGKGKTRP